MVSAHPSSQCELEFILGADLAPWEKRQLGELVRFEGGSQPPRFTFIYEERVGTIRLIQIRDYKSDEWKTFIPVNLARKKCTSDDIMIGRYGPPIFQILRGLTGAYNVALIKAIPTDELLRPYLYHFLKQPALLRFVESLSQRTSGQTGIEMDALKEYPFPLPPTKFEQNAIAAALDDTDALISSLEKLIEKKRNIKQGAIQELLTGKRRLPGFSVEWKTIKLGEAIDRILGGGTPSRAIPAFWGGGLPWVTVKDFTTYDPYSTQETITATGLQNSSSRLVPKGTLIISTRMALGKAVIYQVDVCIHKPKNR
jgi:type I restriction enzyme, S subunit